MAGERTGHFRDVMEGRQAAPAVARLPGLELVAIDPERGWIRTRFAAKPDFLHTAGSIQGDFLAAMLDATLGPALTATLSRDPLAPTESGERITAAPATARILQR